jgi:hypothetical protein
MGFFSAIAAMVGLGAPAPAMPNLLLPAHRSRKCASGTKTPKHIRKAENRRRRKVAHESRRRNR